MSLLTALLAAVLLAVPSGPDAGSETASHAFARGEYALAEHLALDEASGPHPGAALYLAGLSRFRLKDSARALALLDKAWDTNDRPAEGAFRFNRASCLYDLGRFAEAENEYTAAAGLDDSLAFVSLVDAGFAALDGGEPDRARALSARASALSTPATRALLDDLDAQLATALRQRARKLYLAGLAAYDASSFAAAREQFDTVAALEPMDAKSRIMAAAASIQLGEKSRARAGLREALSLRIDAEDAQIARDYLDSLSPGAAAHSGFQGTARIIAGFDSNALQTGFLEPNEFTGANTSTSPSAFATAEAGLAWRGSGWGRFIPEVAYGLEQLAYFAADARDRSLQQHTLIASLETPLGDDARAGLSLGAQLAFTGLDQFRGLQLNGLSSLWAAYDESGRLTSRLELGFEPKLGLSEFDYLSGNRYDAAFTQELHFAPAAFTLGYRFRAELLGIASEAVTQPPPPQLCPAGCTQTLSDPFGYTSSTLWLSARASVGRRWSFEASGGAEWRNYTDDNYLLITEMDGPEKTADRRRRHDTRWFASAAASFWLLPSLALTLRYDLVLNRSDIDSRASGGGGECGPPDYHCHQLDAEVRSYDKHVLSLGTVFNW